MGNAEPQIFDGSVEFPTIPQEKVPAEGHALRRILAGQRAVAKLYASLDACLSGESHCLVVLLCRDFERRFRGLLGAGEALLTEIDAGAVSEESLPAQPAIARISESLVGRPPGRILQVVSAFVSRALICHQMVPWVANVKRVFGHFQTCVEAEDHHLAVMDFFRELLESPAVGASA
jgi:hypothetical protein